MTAQGWWILAGLIVGGLNVLAWALVAKFEDEWVPPRVENVQSKVTRTRRDDAA